MPTRHSERSEESAKQDVPCHEPRFFEQPPLALACTLLLGYTFIEGRGVAQYG